MRVVMTRLALGCAQLLGSTAVIAAEDDPASLDRLADIVIMAPVSWWPLARGWQVLIALALGLAIVALVATYRRRRLNAYRAVALGELERLERNPSALPHIAEILKRTALVAAPRHQVANLSGEAWMHWLNQRGDGAIFSAKSMQLLSEDLYTGKPADVQDIDGLLSSARAWIVSHRPGHLLGAANAPKTAG